VLRLLRALIVKMPHSLAYYGLRVKSTSVIHVRNGHVIESWQVATIGQVIVLILELKQRLNTILLDLTP